MTWTMTLWLLCYVLVFAGLSAFGAHRLRILWLYWKHRKEEPQPTTQFQELPLVTVQLPIFNEVHVVKGLLDSVSKLDYSKEKLQIQILDDSTDETRSKCEEGAAQLRVQGFDAEHLHRTDRTGFKAGALEAAMDRVKGEYIMIFDADFTPGPDVLKKMVHFFTDEKVALVQARWGHANRRDSLLTRLQAMMLDGHLALEQPARSRGNLFFNFNGTAGIWRKKAIVDAGGWDHDTLTEDMDLSYRAQLKGWKFHYLKDLAIPAELPPDMDGFKSQQHRWTKGSVQVCKKILGTIWKSDQPLSIKLEATVHLTANFAYLLMLAVLVMVYPSNFIFESSPAKMALIDLPVFFLATLSSLLFYGSAQLVLSKSPWDWIKCLPFLPLLMALGIGMSINNGVAVIEALFNKKSDFVRTPKYGQQMAVKRKRSRYKAARSITFWVEVALALYFSLLVVGAIMEHRWVSVIFLALFQFGFSYVVGASASRWFSEWNLTPPPPPQETSSDPAIA